MPAVTITFEDVEGSTEGDIKGSIHMDPPFSVDDEMSAAQHMGIRTFHYAMRISDVEPTPDIPTPRNHDMHGRL